MQRYLLLLALLALGCSDSSTSPSTSTAPLHNIPKVGSTFTIRAFNSGETAEFPLTVTATGQELEGYKNVAMFGSFGVAYETNGDISFRYDHGWITLPVKTQRPVVIPTTVTEEGRDLILLRDQTITTDGEETRVIGRKSYKCMKFLVQDRETYVNSVGSFISTDTLYGHISWAPDLGYFAMIRNIYRDGSGPFLTTIDADLK